MPAYSYQRPMSTLTDELTKQQQDFLQALILRLQKKREESRKGSGRGAQNEVISILAEIGAYSSLCAIRDESARQLGGES